MSHSFVRSATASLVEGLEARRLFAVVQADPSDDFVESIGINYRSGQNNSNVTQYQTIKSKLGDLGIRYIRDSISSTDTAQQNRVLELNNLYGIKFEAFFDTRTNGVLDPSKIDALVNFYDNYPNLFWGIDGPNEYDSVTSPTKYADLLNYQQQIYNKINANAVLKDLPIVGPPFGQIGRYIEALGQQGIGAYYGATDASNIHAYPSNSQFPMQPNYNWENTAKRFHAQANIGSFTANEATSSGSPVAANARTQTFAARTYNPGDDLYISFGRSNSDVAPIDYVQFNPVGGGASIRIEAENMQLSGNAVVGNATAASGGKYVYASTGGAAVTALFSGSTGSYTVTVGYFDENDGSAAYSIVYNTNKRPIYWTETGYHNALNNGGVTEAISSIYTPQIFLGGYERGYEKTFLYTVIDNASDPNGLDREKNFGLLRYDGTEKPAFGALENFIDLMQDPGQSFAPGTLDYSITGSTNNLKTQLFQKRDGKFMLPIYVEGLAHNASTQAIAEQTRSITLNFGQSISSVKVYYPNDSATPSQTFTNPTSINLTARSKVAVLEITPTVATVTPLNNWTFEGGSTAFTNGFNINTVSNNKFNWSSTAGTGGGAGVNLPAGQFTSAVLNTSFSGFNTYQTITQSIDANIIGTGTAAPTGQAFFGTLNTTNATGLGGVGFGVRYTGATSPKFNVVLYNGGTETVLGTLNFGSLSWYRFEAGWTRDTSDNKLDLSLKLYSLGGDGLGTPTLLNTFSQTNITNASVTGGSSLYVGYHGKFRDNAGVKSFDNLETLGLA